MGTLTPEVVALIRDLRDALGESHPVDDVQKYANRGCERCKLLVRADALLSEEPT